MEIERKKFSADLTLEKLEKVSDRAWIKFNPYDLFNAAESLLEPIERNQEKNIDLEQARQSLITAFKIADMLHEWNKEEVSAELPISNSEIFRDFNRQTCPISGFAVDVETRTTLLQRSLGLRLK